MASNYVEENIQKSPRKNVMVLDPSDKFRPEKKEDLFRNYTSNNIYHNRVRNTYYQMHSQQTLQYAKDRLAKWSKFDHGEHTAMEAVLALKTLVDESDPDVNIPNSVHAFQTAERIRQMHPDKDWFHLTGLIHDIGKVMAVWGEPQESQTRILNSEIGSLITYLTIQNHFISWSVVGDTFPLGCQFSDKIVFGRKSFEENKDYNHSVYSTKLGIYKDNCGLEDVVMSWGHDEYLYRVLKNHKACRLPEEALYIIRFHSFYPWHTGDDYMHLCNNIDLEMLKWVKEFNQFDLYSKSDPLPDEDSLIDYYQSLADKYIPGAIKF